MNISDSTHQKDFSPQQFKTPFWLQSPHIQTILPKFIVKKEPQYRREIYKDSYNTSDIAYDFYEVAHQDSNTTKNTTKNTSDKILTPLVVLFHGLEGSSTSHYAMTLAHQVHAFGWNFVVPHYRSCGGIDVGGDIFYNAGDSKEAHYVLTQLRKRYKTIYAIGVSLGGNVLAKYMSEMKEHALCDSAVVISAPLDLASSATAMQKGLAKHVYTPYLLNPLVKKALKVNLSEKEYQGITQSQDVYEFDNAFTAPRHGFCSVNEYYYKSSALPILKDINKPTLIITAKDDPFLGVTATESDISNSVTLLKTEHGGHIGFLRFNKNKQSKRKFLGKFDTTWAADTALDFFNAHSVSV